MRQALIALFHESSFGLLIKPPEEDYSRIGQTSSSRTGRTSGLPSCSVINQSGSMSKGKRPTDPTGVRVQGSLAFLEFVAGRARANLVHRFGVVNFGSEAPRKNAV